MEGVYDNSQLVTYTICPFKYYLQYIYSIRKKDVDETVIKFKFGQWVHQFLEHHFKGEEITAENMWNDYEDFVEEQLLTRENGIRLCNDYVDRWQHDRSQFTVLDVEKKVEFPLGRYNFIVKLDTVIEQQGCKYSLEHKTTQKSPQYALRTYEMSSQITAQTYAVKLKYGSCSGVMVDMIVPKFITKPILFAPDHEDIKLYTIVEKKYSKYYKQDMYYCSGYTTIFEREIFNRFEEQVEGWKANAIEIMNKIEWDKKREYFCKHDHGYFCGGCQYKELCAMSHDMKIDEGVLELSYEKCNPWEYLEI